MLIVRAEVLCTLRLGRRLRAASIEGGKKKGKSKKMVIRSNFFMIELCSLPVMRLFYL